MFPGAVRTLDLPRYPWQRQSYWLPGRTLGAGDPLLGTPGEPGPGVTHVFAVADAGTRAPWLADHAIGGVVVMPATGLLAVLRAAAPASGAGVAITDVVIREPLVLDAPGVGWRTAVGERDQDDGSRPVEIWSVVPGHPDRQIAEARLGAPAADPAPAADIDSDAAWVTGGDRLYAALRALGADFGPTFRTVVRWRTIADGRTEAWLAAAPEGAPGGRLPGLLDGALQTCLLAATRGQLPTELLLPLAVDRVQLDAPSVPAEVRAVARVRERGERTLHADVDLYDREGRPIGRIVGARLAAAGPDALAALAHRPAPVYDTTWVIDDAGDDTTTADPGTAPVPGTWLVVTAGPAGDTLADRLAEAGRPVTRVTADTLADALNTPDELAAVVHAIALDPPPVDRADPGERSRRLVTPALQLLAATDRLAGSTVWWLTRGAQPAAGQVSDPDAAALWGLAGVAERELPDVDLRLLDLPSHPVPGVPELLGDPTAPPRVALRGIARWVPRVVPHRVTGVTGELRLRPDPAGTLDAIAWVAAEPQEPGPGEVRLRVLAAGLNFRDALLALGAYPGGAAALGVECSGIVAAVGEGVTTLAVGQRVFGYAPHSLATSVVVPARYLREIPETMAADDAATLPIAHFTARYGLGRLAGLRHGQRVLIHAAAGGVGLAAVQYAQALGAEVLATAGSPAKRRLLRELGVRTIGDSRSAAFAADVLAATSGRGVDVVLNSLSGDLIDASVSVLAEGATFLELGKRGVWTAEQMAAQRPDVTFHAFDLGAEAAADPALLPAMFDELLADWQAGRLTPLPVRVFPAGDAALAVRTLAHADHVGKLVVRAPGRADAGRVTADATYLVTGGTGALGQHSARWLADRGARHIVLTGRTAPAPGAAAAIAELTGAGVHVAVRTADAGDPDAVAGVLGELADAWPPLRGVIHAAGVHDDGPLLQQTWSRFAPVLAGKGGGATVLDRLAGTQLDWFVMYSAGGLLLGAPGQGPYAAANAQLDALAWYRRGRGEHALSVAWGPWAEGGMAARLRDAGDHSWERRGVGWLSAAAALGALERLLGDDSVHATVMSVDWPRLLAGLPAGADTSRYTAVTPAAAPGAGASSRAGVVDGWRAAAPADRRRLVIEHVAERARHVIGLAPDHRFDTRAALKESGLDSLMAVELRNVLTRSLATNLPATLLFDYPSLEQLAEYLGERLELGPYDTTVVAQRAEDDGSASAAGDTHADVVGLSDAEAEALLLAELGDPGEGR